MTLAGAEPTAQASAPPPALVDQIGAEQVSELFRDVTLGVVAASVGAAVLGATLYRLGFAEAQSALGWTSFIILCALAHIALRRRYDRAIRRSAQWRSWAVTFTMISLAEGIGWGWGTLGLASGGGLEVLLLILVVTLATAAGAASIFSPYLPAFLALLLPATLPYLIASLGAPDPLQVASVFLMLVFIGGIGGVGVTMNRSFKALVGLRIHAEQMARELGRQRRSRSRRASPSRAFWPRPAMICASRCMRSGCLPAR